MDSPFARYDIVSEVHRSDRAVVFQAIDRELGQQVALKVYEYDDDAQLAALRAEAQVLHQLEAHPALPRTRHDFATDGQYCIVMSWVDGVDLQRLVDDDGDPGLPVPQVLDVLARVGGAIDHLHAHDPVVVHGDVKPANIVRRADGSVVLVDFGMAAMADPARTGTLGFMAPEVAGGEKPGPAADVYGLAATAVALLTGAPPSGAGVVPPGLEARLGATWTRALRRALSVDPEKRPASCRDLVERLRAGGHGELPVGVVTLVAAELSGSARLWEDHGEEMPGVLARLGDLVAEVVDRADGAIVGTMADGHRVMAVFTRVTAAVRAARSLHERVVAESWPVDLRVALRAAVETGEVDAAHGAYTGAVVDRVLWMRSIAPVGATVTSAATVALFRDDADAPDLVDLGEVEPPDGGRAQHLFAVGPVERPSEPQPRPAPIVADDDVDLPDLPPEAAPVPVGRIVADVVQQPLPLGGFTVFALTVVYLLLLEPQLGLGGPVALLALGSLGVGVVATIVGTRMAIAADRTRVADERAHRELVERANDDLRETDRLRRSLRSGFADIGARAGVDELERLDTAYRTFRDAMARAEHLPWTPTRLLPDLADDTYRRGLSVLSDALELLTVASALRPDDDQRETVERFRALGGELLEQAGRCTHVLNRACLEVTVMRVQPAESSVGAVVETMEMNLERVRDVQDAFRRLDTGSGPMRTDPEEESGR